MKIIRTPKAMQDWTEACRREGFTIGLVPTMGDFHAGHLSLIRIARARADRVAISIFVNPTQFGPEEDLNKYPRNMKRDTALAETEGVDVIFCPDDAGMYPEGFASYVNVEHLTERMCGHSRPHHFRGVTTICTKLFLCVKPHFAVFGQKDAQQTVVIQRMVDDLNFDLEIIIAPIVRENDGLAMSSRNAYLTPEERLDAAVLNQALITVKKMIEEGEQQSSVVHDQMKTMILKKAHTRIDYIEIVNPRTLMPVKLIREPVLVALAVFVGKTRLIDNVIC